jgi:DNA-binding transcriptional LysR family regulator
MNAIDVRRLRYFVAVADELHFGRAAVKLAVTQPALSQQISALEATLGVQLLVRDRRSVALTKAGETFRDRSREILVQLDALVEDTRAIALQNQQRVTVAMVEYTDLLFIVPALTEMQRLYPGIKISRKEMVSSQQVRALIAGQIDVGVGVLLSNEDTVIGIAARPLIEGRWLLAAPRRHRLAHAGQVRLSDLKDEPLIIFARSVNAPLYDQVVDRFRKEKVEPNFVYETAQAQIGLRIVGDGGGLMLGADYALREASENISYVPLEGLPDLKVNIFWRSNESSGLVLDLVELLAERWSDLQG